MASSASPEPTARKSEKKLKKEKKRAREEDAFADGERKHKKSKSVSVLAGDVDAAINGEKSKKKKKKAQKEEQTEEDVPETEEVVANGEEEAPKKKHKKKHDQPEATDETVDKSEKKKKKKKKAKEEEEEEAQPEPEPVVVAADPDAMDVDEAPSKSSDSKIYQPPGIPANPQFPFFTQTISLYEPLFPVGWTQPVTSCQYQHLRHLQNKYVPSLRGVLLDYRNVGFGENPGRKGAALTDNSPTTILSKDEAAVGFGWITADVDLFVPSRGAWMEGSINLQTEGHIGVVCFGKFNASIEARRLPPSWKWVPNESPEAQGFEETASVITADDHGVVRQIHSTGFWADGDGEKVKGKIRFRIRNFDVGTSGETSYLSLEGTMLDKAGEKTVVAEEAEAAKQRKGGRGTQKRQRRRVPEFSMTRFNVEEEEQQVDNEAERREVLAVEE